MSDYILMGAGFPSINRNERIERNWKRERCNGTGFLILMVTEGQV